MFTVGLSKPDKKYLEFAPFPKSKEFSCGRNYGMAQQFYRSFKLIFGNGHKTINFTSPTGSQSVDIPNFSELISRHMMIIRKCHKLIKVDH